MRSEGLLVQDQDSWKLFGKRESKASCCLNVVLPEKMERIEVSQFQEMPDTKSTMRNFSARFSIFWSKGNTTIKLQLQVDLAFYQEIKLHARGPQSRERVSVCDRLIGVRLLDC